MLQRAASNAYSWWWASHIRTKQSKWMEQNLIDMEEKVQNVLKLIEEDGDSFARRAEMYYKKRPELIFFVEEFYRAYRALAERYDHISTELQNANNTIASVFPEQVQFSMDEEDEEAMPKFKKKPRAINKANIPKVPNAPMDLKSVVTTATKKLRSKKSGKLAAVVSAVVKSGLNKQEALKEIDKLQKHILSLQTEKEFLKSSYESQLARYWEIENQIKEMQDRVFNLQDEYGEGIAIEDDEARNLMAKAALKSCQESLAQLQEKQERSAEEARIESTRVKEVRERLASLKGELHGDGPNGEKPQAKTEPGSQKPVPDQLNQEVNSPEEEKQKAEQIRQKIKEQLEASTCLNMTEMAEKIDELVNKVISLETALSSQTALVNQLRSETDQLQAQIRTLEVDKASMIDGKKNLQQKLKDMEKKLGGLQNLNQKVENGKSNFQSQIISASCNLDHLSGKLPSIQQDEDPEPKSSISMVQLEQPEKFPGVKLGSSGPHTELKQPNEKLKDHEEPEPKSSISTVRAEQLERLPGEKLDATGPHAELKQSNEKLQAQEEPNPKSSISTVQVQQPEELPGVKLDASGPHTQLKQSNEKLQAQEEPKPKSLISTVQVQQPEELPGVELDASGPHTQLKQSNDEKLQAQEEPNPKSLISMVQVQQPEELPGVKLDASGPHTQLKQSNDEKLQAQEEPKPKSLISMVQVQQPEELPGVKLDASGPHTQLKQPDEKLKAHEGSDNPKQMGLDEDCQVTDSRRTSKLQSPKEEESQNFKGKSEKADASSMNRNQENICPVQMDPPNLGSNSKKLRVTATSRSLQVLDTQDNSQSSMGSYEKSDADAADKSGEVIAQTLSVKTEGNPKKNDSYGSARNLVEDVQTKAYSEHSEGGHEEARVNTTSRSQVEEVQIQDKSQNSKGSYEDSNAGNTAKGPQGIVPALSVSTEGNPEKNGDNGSAGTRRKDVRTKANSQYSEGGTLTSQVEEIHEQVNLGHPSEKNKEEKKKTCSEAVGAEQVVNEVDEPNWENLFLSGVEDREKVLLSKYTTTLRHFKDAKKKLNEMDEKNRDHHLQTLKQLNELKTANALKDQEIRSLHHKLNLMQKCFYESRESVDLSAQSIDFSASDDKKPPCTSKDQNVKTKTTEGDSTRFKTLTRQVADDNLGFDISKLLVQQPDTMSEIEEGLRMKIDELLEENLDFWLKFSSSFHQMQKFETGIQDLKEEVTKLQDKGKKLDESGSGKLSLKSEARPLYKHLREIQNELNVWSDKSAELQGELEDRFSSLCNIQEEITAGLKASAEDDDFSFTSYQAAKFQGEVLNMKQENNKVANELQAALDHIGSLQFEVESNLTKLNEEFRLAGLKQESPQMRNAENRVPLRSFIFGVKPKKQKQSIFSGMAPVMQKKYYALKTGNL